MTPEDLLASLSTELRGIRGKNSIGRAKAAAAVSDSFMKVLMTDVYTSAAHGRKPQLDFFKKPKRIIQSPVLEIVTNKPKKVIAK
jgi:hypothetical protein